MSFKYIGSNDPGPPAYVKLDVNFIHCLFICLL